MGEQNISLESIVQRKGKVKIKEEISASMDAKPQDVVLLTYKTTEEAVRKALEAVQKDGHVVASPQMIRIERL